MQYKIECCRKATGMPKFLASWSAFWTGTHSIENARLHSFESSRKHSFENSWFMQRLWHYSVLCSLKFYQRKFIVFLHFFVNYIKLSYDKFRILMMHCGPNNLLLWELKEKDKSMLRFPYGGRSWCTESSNFAGENFPFNCRENKMIGAL